MSDFRELLEARGFRLEKLDHALQVYQVEGDADFFLVDSAYELDYVNEEALLYMLSAEKPVLVHVPLMLPFEEYLESFKPYEGLPIHFLIHGPEDGALFDSNVDYYLEKMQQTRRK